MRFPKLFSDMVRFTLKQDLTTAKKLNDQLIEAYDLMFAENNPAGIKAFLTEMDLLENHLRLPMTSLSSGIHQQVRTYLGK